MLEVSEGDLLGFDVPLESDDFGAALRRVTHIRSLSHLSHKRNEDVLRVAVHRAERRRASQWREEERLTA